MEGVNEQALDEVREFVDLASQKNHQIVLFHLVERFAGRPWGWPDEETLSLVARLLVMGEIQLIKGAEPLPPEQAYDEITSSQKQRRISVIRRNRPDQEKLAACRSLGRELFNEMGPDNEAALHDFLRGHFEQLKASLATHRAVAETGSYPGSDEITKGLRMAAALLATKESGSFFARFLENKAALEDFAYDYADVAQFFASQRPQRDRLRKVFEAFQQNSPQLEADDTLAKALTRMQEILKAKSPYKLLSEAAGLIEKVQATNAALVDAARTSAAAAIGRVTSRVTDELAAHGLADDGLATTCLAPLAALKDSLARQASVAHLTRAIRLADERLDAALARIEQAIAARARASAGSQPTASALKPRHTLRPASLAPAAWLDSEADVTAFLEALKAELTAARGERIQIR